MTRIFSSLLLLVVVLLIAGPRAVAELPPVDQRKVCLECHDDI